MKMMRVNVGHTPTPEFLNAEYIQLVQMRMSVNGSGWDFIMFAVGGQGYTSEKFNTIGDAVRWFKKTFECDYVETK